MRDGDAYKYFTESPGPGEKGFSSLYRKKQNVASSCFAHALPMNNPFCRPSHRPTQRYGENLFFVARRQWKHFMSKSDTPPAVSVASVKRRHRNHAKSLLSSAVCQSLQSQRALSCGYFHGLGHALSHARMHSAENDVHWCSERLSSEASAGLTCSVYVKSVVEVLRNVFRIEIPRNSN
jgi:hypothetical protein